MMVRDWCAAATAACFAISGLLVPANARPVEKVVAIGGTITEIVYRLDRESALVAADSTSTYPEAAQNLPDVGYMRELAAEPILSLDPERVIAAADAGPPVVFDKLRSAGVSVTRVPDEATPDGVMAKVTAVAEALDARERGESLVNRLATRFEALDRMLQASKGQPTALVLIAAGAGNLMVAGRDTSASGILELAGARQAVDDYSGYRPLAAEAVVDAEPQWLVMTETALESLGGRDEIREHPALGSTPAARDGRIVALDGLLLLGFGPRTPKAATRLAERFHANLPEAAE